MMNKYTLLLQKYLKILIFTSLVLSLFWGLGMLFRTSQTLETSTANDVTDYKSAFFEAMQKQDLQKGRVAYESLKKILPPEDPFITEIAPAYLADLYVKYAKALHYDKKSSEMMLSKAKQFVPQHPAILAMEQSFKLESQPVTVQAQTDTPPQPVPSVQPEIIAQVDLSVIQESIQEVNDGPPRIPFIDPPPLMGFEIEPEYTLQPEMEVAQTAPPESTLPSSDPCSLSYLTKNHSLTACIDPVTDNRFGPALFVVGDKNNQAQLAFMQQPLSFQDYDLFCDSAGQCYEEVEEEAPSLIDLSDVQETVHDYNAYCQMSGSCDKIEEQSKKVQKPLTRGQAQRYALWLSKVTGYKYRLITLEDTKLIQQYYQSCVITNECAPGIMDSLASLIKHPDTLLVREIKN